MTRIRNLTCAFLSLVLATFIGYATPAAAQATRTWVSGVGDDVNPCSRTAPCKTFAGAISKTAPGGEINCLDPGGFGAVTINKALTINCLYTEGGVLAGGNGIVVNAGASDVVFLRGLDIFGVNPPTNGVRFIAGAALHIEDSTIRRFNAASSFGVSFQPTGNSRLYIRNTTIAENGSAATGGGILIQPTGAGGNARVFMDNVHVANNANNALRVDTNGNTSGTGVIVDIRGSEFSGSTNGISVNAPPGFSSVELLVARSDIFANSTAGLSVTGSGALMRVADNTITANGVGMSINAAGQMFSYGGNITDGNTSASSFSGTIGKN